jgi:DNA-binding MarR family transcriptional regulator/N-acetylglutamate synthase-like GNAT family acetyltransferase
MAELGARIAAVRRFSRFYTQRIGVLQEGLLASPFSLTEARLLYELAQVDGLSAAALARELALDPGYLSRILTDFTRRGLVAKRPSPADGRQTLLSLTEAGRAAFAPLDAGARDQVGAMLARLSAQAQRGLVAAMAAIERLLGDAETAREPYLLRPHQPGDIGWVTHRHGVLYAEEYGWDERFEALVAEIAAKFVTDFDAKRERCWIAERDGAIVGSVFLVRQSDTVAKLRLLLVEPDARGLGIGKRLVQECIRFARRLGYREITLWTNDILVAARRIYEAAGFVLVAEERHHSFGHDLVGQTWTLAL